MRALVLTLLVWPLLLQAEPARLNPPDVIASTGDSITRAFNTGTFLQDAPANSWSTGTSLTVNSQFNRLLDLEPAAAGNNHNHAITGARMGGANGLLTQLNSIVTAGVTPDYVTILLGANDVCTGTEASMTSAAAFRTLFEGAMTELTGKFPDALIFVGSIPDVWQLWNLFKADQTALFVWQNAGICQSLLDQADSMAQADVDRRARVRQRARDLNAVLQSVCAGYLRCRYDDHAINAYAFQTADVSTRDYFHPSVEGQRRLAEATWAATFDFTDFTPPVTLDTQTHYPTGNVGVTLSASDDVGLRGIELRQAGGPWEPYPAGTELVLTPTAVLEYRAIDVNGNVEASQAWVYRPPPPPPPPATGEPPITGEPEPAVPTQPETGCGCTTLPSPAAALALLLLGALYVPARQKRS